MGGFEDLKFTQSLSRSTSNEHSLVIEWITDSHRKTRKTVHRRLRKMDTPLGHRIGEWGKTVDNDLCGLPTAWSLPLARQTTFPRLKIHTVRTFNRHDTEEIGEEAQTMPKTAPPPHIYGSPSVRHKKRDAACFDDPAKAPTCTPPPKAWPEESRRNFSD